MKRFITLLLLPLIYLLVAHGQQTTEEKVLEDSSTGANIENAAKTQIGKTTWYDPAYKAIPYPMSDIPIDKRVCSDMVIRTLRDPLNHDQVCNMTCDAVYLRHVQKTYLKCVHFGHNDRELTFHLLV